MPREKTLNDTCGFRGSCALTDGETAAPDIQPAWLRAMLAEERLSKVAKQRLLMTGVVKGQLHQAFATSHNFWPPPMEFHTRK